MAVTGLDRATKHIVDYTDGVIAWLAEGEKKGYCTALCCSTHTADYLTEEESELMMDGEDPCVFVVRVNTVPE